MTQFKIVPESKIGRWATACLSPLMRILSGAPAESPQVTHFWNNRALTKTEFALLDDDFLSSAINDPEAVKRKFRCDVRFHIPILGGWSKYVVVRPKPGHIVCEYWYVGWETLNSAGVSQVPIKRGRVRLLLGPEKTAFFGLDRDGVQIPVMIEAVGRIGDGVDPYGQLPLH